MYGSMLHWPPKASKLRFLSLFTINMKFQIDRVPSCPTLEIWDFGRMMASGAQRLKIVIFEFIHHQYKISNR
jgi:hypothetical protein